MKKIYLLALATVFGLNAMAQQKSNVVVFAEDGETFFAFLNGVKQNATAQANVRITDIPGEGASLRIVFANSNDEPLKQNMFFSEPNHEHTVKIKRDKKGVLKMKYFGSVPLAQSTSTAAPIVYTTTEAPVATTNTNTVTSTGTINTTTTNPYDNSGTVNMNVQVTDPNMTGGNVNMNTTVSDPNVYGTTSNSQTVTTTTTTTNGAGTNVNNGSGNVNMSVGVGENGFNMNVNVSGTANGGNINMSGTGMNGTTTETVSTTTTTTTTTNGYTTSSSTTTNGSTGYNTTVTDNSAYTTGNMGNTTTATANGCVYATDEVSFGKMKKAVESATFSDTKMSTAKTGTRNTCLSTDQVKEIMALFNMDDDKLAYAQYAYDYTVDKNNFYLLGEAFTFDGTKEELNQFLETKR